MNANPIQRKNSEPGQALVLVALLLLGLLATLAFVLDGGNIYLQRRRMQNAADSGAMAGALILALNGTEAEARAVAQDYAMQRNKADVAQITITPAQITVIAEEHSATTFARIIGIDQLTVTARAVAKFAPVGSLGGLAPIAVRDFDYSFSVPYTIWDDNPDVPPDPTLGNISGSYRGWLNLPCVYPMSCGDAGAGDLKTWMVNGYPEITRVNTWVTGSSGVKASTIAQAMVGQVLKIAVYDDIQDKYSNKAYYHILKFAAFKVTRVYASGNPKGIEGTFAYAFTPGPPDGGEDGGMRTISLTN